jgi:hypothetical protein
MPKKKRRDTPAKQSQRFVETAKALGVDESGKAFEKAINMIVTPKAAIPVGKGNKDRENQR